MTADTNYEIKLEIFQGPLDLLLHLIRKNEVDIFDIPIALITDQFLEYLDLMKALNINVAGDFLVMASTLVHIKSRLLLPDYDDGSEEEDPREEITGPLLEYIRLKEVAGDLSERKLLDRDVFRRSIPSDYIDHFQAEGSLLDVNLFQLMDAFKRIIEQELPNEPVTFNVEPWSIKERTAFIIELLKKSSTFYFKDLFSDNKTITEFIITFLALLELVHMGLVRVFQPALEKDIRLEAHFDDNKDVDHG
ncbi:MAG: segregation/condensation protein A [Deltaproteobacteria bacterium]|nr:segregation/condensation protein A [Deltaproteobacteria bacterium]